MHDFLIITLAVFADVLFPGPNFILCSSVAVNSGFKKSLYLIYGILLGCISWCIFLIFGVVSLFTKYPFLKNGIKFIGSLYLIFLALNMIIFSIKNQNLDKKINDRERNSVGFSNLNLLLKGFVNCILNPEVGLFYMIMFTRVIDKYGISYKWLILSSIDFIFIQFICFFCIAFIFSKLSTIVLKHLRFINLGLSIMLLYLAIKLLKSIFI